MFLYFIEIAHTDDFPSTGTRLVYYHANIIRRYTTARQMFTELRLGIPA